MSNSSEEILQSSVAALLDLLSSAAQSSESAIEKSTNLDLNLDPIQENKHQLSNLYYLLAVLLVVLVNIGPFLYYRLVKKYYIKDANRQHSSFR